MSKCDLRNTCNELSLRIRLTRIRNHGNTHVDYYGNSEAEDHFNLGLYNDHYFINGRTNLTAFCLENCVDVMFIEDCNKIYRKDGQHIGERATGI